MKRNKALQMHLFHRRYIRTVHRAPCTEGLRVSREFAEKQMARPVRTRRHFTFQALSAPPTRLGWLGRGGIHSLWRLSPVPDGKCFIKINVFFFQSFVKGARDPEKRRRERERERRKQDILREPSLLFSVPILGRLLYKRVYFFCFCCAEG